MDARELRIGNIVNFLDGSSWLQGPVKNIGELKSVVGIRAVKNINIQGIRITEEWLFKFGFREMEDTIPEGYPTFWPPNCNRFRFYYSDTNQAFNCDAFDWGAGQSVERVASLKYVHQLQNLHFVITGDELTLQI